jgi:hypothetical protein
MPMEAFEFHAELFEVRSAVIQALAEHGYVVFADYGAVDLQHDVYGLEVTAIRDEADAKSIEGVLRRLLPDWRHTSTFYEDRNLGELGWKVTISRRSANCEDGSHFRRPLVPIFEGKTHWYLKIAGATAFGLVGAVATVLARLLLDAPPVAEIVATVIGMPMVFALAATILVILDTIRGKMCQEGD